MHFKNLIALLLLALFSGTTLAADDIVLNPNQPGRYVVRQGDTLWDIASKFLRDPWRWPDVWEFDTTAEGKQYLYPGDVIVLQKTNGKPVLRVQRGATKQQTVRLSPRVRATTLDRAVPSLPVDAVKQFLSQPRVLSERELRGSAYIVSSFGEHLVTSTGDQIYARGIPAGKNTTYAIYRPGKTYQNVGGRPDEVLGYEAIIVGTAQVKNSGDPATLQIIESRREALIGDLLLPVGRQEIDEEWLPRAPDMPVEGRVIDVLDAVSRVGQYQTVVLNVGEFDGLQRGHVLAIYQAGADARDVVSPDPRDTVQLPDVRSGLAMVYKTFDRVSYALVMKAESDVRLHDIVRKP